VKNPIKAHILIGVSLFYSGIWVEKCINCGGAYSLQWTCGNRKYYNVSRRAV